MIRDSYYKEHKNSGLTSRELKGIQKFGERAFYTSSVTKMSGNVKSFNFSFKVSLICSSLLLLLILIVVTILLYRKDCNGCNHDCSSCIRRKK